MKLPVNEKFILYRDDDDDYNLEMTERPKHIIGTHGKTPDEAVKHMENILDILEAVYKESPCDIKELT